MGAKRPLLVTLIGVLYLILALLFFAAGAVFLLTGTSVDIDPDLQALSGVAGGVYIVVGLIYLIVSLGFFKGWKLWWYLGVIFSILGIIGGILSLMSGMYASGIIGILIDLIIIWYLFRDNVKAFFFD